MATLAFQLQVHLPPVLFCPAGTCPSVSPPSIIIKPLVFVGVVKQIPTEPDWDYWAIYDPYDIRLATAIHNISIVQTHARAYDPPIKHVPPKSTPRATDKCTWSLLKTRPKYRKGWVILFMTLWIGNVFFWAQITINIAKLFYNSHAKSKVSKK